MEYSLNKIWDGRMGQNLRPYWEILIAGVIVGGSSRKKEATAIAEAIVAGKIEATGDTTRKFEIWAYDNDRALFDRLYPDKES